MGDWAPSWRHVYVPPTAVLPPLLSSAAEDMWHVFNLIREGDHVTATTFRKVSKETGTGAESERIKIKLTIEVEAIEFDAEGVLVMHGTPSPRLLPGLPPYPV